MPDAIAIPERCPDITCSNRLSQPSDDPTGRSMPVSRMACPSKWLRVRYGIAIACSATNSFCCQSSRNGARPGASPNVSFKFTGINLDCLAADGLDPAEHLRLVADQLGVDRLVIGSDIGQTRGPYSRIVDGLREATRLLDDAERAAVLHDNAARIYSR